MQTIYCNGADIYNAAIAGAAQGYNRSTDDSSAYAEMLRRSFKEIYYDTRNTEEQMQQIWLKTKGRWEKAVFALTLAMEHKHKHGMPCEAHARVFLNGEMRDMFDITLRDWNALKANNVVVARKQAA